MARLQRAVRPSAGYARSLAVLARAKDAGLTVKSGLILGMGETEDEVVGALADLRGVGVDIVTIGQYLRPSAAHLPVARWWTPEEFDRLRRDRRGHGLRPRAVVAADPFELPRPRRRGRRRASAVGVEHRSCVGAASASTVTALEGRQPGSGRRQGHAAGPGPPADGASAAWTPCCCRTEPICPG